MLVCLIDQRSQGQNRVDNEKNAYAQKQTLKFSPSCATPAGRHQTSPKGVRTALYCCRPTTEQMGPGRSQQPPPLPPHLNPLSLSPLLPRECLVDVEVAQRAGSVSIQPVVDLALVKLVEAREDSHAIPGLGSVGVVGATKYRSRRQRGQMGTGVSLLVLAVSSNARCNEWLLYKLDPDVCKCRTISPPGPKECSSNNCRDSVRDALEKRRSTSQAQQSFLPPPQSPCLVIRETNAARPVVGIATGVGLGFFPFSARLGLAFHFRAHLLGHCYVFVTAARHGAKHLHF